MFLSGCVLIPQNFVKSIGERYSNFANNFRTQSKVGHTGWEIRTLET